MKEELTAAKVFSAMTGKPCLPQTLVAELTRPCSFRHVAKPAVDDFLSRPCNRPSQGLP